MVVERGLAAGEQVVTEGFPANLPGNESACAGSDSKKEDEQPADSLNKKAASENKEKDK